MAKTRLETLQDIISSTQRHLDFVKSQGLLPSISTHHTEDFHILPLSLSTSTDQFKGLLLQHNIPTQIVEAALTRASEVAASYEESYSKSCRRLMAIPMVIGGPSVQDSIDRLHHLFEDSYKNKDLQGFLSKALQAKSMVQITGRDSTTPGLERKPYNHSFTPYLEAYLQQNAYPSPAERKALASKGDMSEYQITTWFQNRRNRAKANRTHLNQLPPGCSVDETLIQAKVKLAAQHNNHESDVESTGDHDQDRPTVKEALNLDELASSSTTFIPKSYQVIDAESCVSSAGAFGLSTSTTSPSAAETPSGNIDNLHKIFGEIKISTTRAESSPSSKPRGSKLKAASPRSSTPKAVSRTNPFKATLRSCFSAAITLTCPRSHPALITQKKTKRIHIPLSIGKSTILEQKHTPVHPYTPPTVLPTWKFHTTPEPEPVITRRKPTIASHAGKTRPGSPYPRQTVSRMSSTSSLSSMASDDSQSSTRSSSSTFSIFTVESSELSTPAQSPNPNNAELVDDTRFSDDIFGDYFFHSNPIPDNFFFDINVEQPFDFDVSLSIAEFDKSASLSIAEFETTTLPSFDFFES